MENPQEGSKHEVTYSNRFLLLSNLLKSLAKSSANIESTSSHFAEFVIRDVRVGVLGGFLGELNKMIDTLLIGSEWRKGAGSFSTVLLFSCLLELRYVLTDMY